MSRHLYKAYQAYQTRPKSIALRDSLNMGNMENMGRAHHLYHPYSQSTRLKTIGIFILLVISVSFLKSAHADSPVQTGKWYYSEPSQSKRDRQQSYSIPYGLTPEVWNRYFTPQQYVESYYSGCQLLPNSNVHSNRFFESPSANSKVSDGKVVARIIPAPLTAGASNERGFCCQANPKNDVLASFCSKIGAGSGLTGVPIAANCRTAMGAGKIYVCRQSVAKTKSTGTKSTATAQTAPNSDFRLAPNGSLLPATTLSKLTQALLSQYGGDPSKYWEDAQHNVYYGDCASTPPSARTCRAVVKSDAQGSIGDRAKVIDLQAVKSDARTKIQDIDSFDSALNVYAQNSGSVHASSNAPAVVSASGRSVADRMANDQSNYNSQNYNRRTFSDDQRQYKQDSQDINNRTQVEATDDCSVSQSVNSNYRCSGTRTVVSVAQGTNQIGQVVGATITSAAGQGYTANAYQEGTASAAYQAAADSARTAAKTQFALGVANTVMGVMQASKASKHGKNISAIRRNLADGSIQGGQNVGVTTSNNSDAASAYTNNDSFKRGVSEHDQLISNAQQADADYALAGYAPRKGNSLTQAAIQNKQNYVNETTQRIRSAAISEQENIKEEAKQGTFASMMSAAQNFLGWKNNKDFAKAQQTAADALKKVENPGKPPGFDEFETPESTNDTGVNLPPVTNNQEGATAIDPNLADGTTGNEGDPLASPLGNGGGAADNSIAPGSIPGGGSGGGAGQAQPSGGGSGAGSLAAGSLPSGNHDSDQAQGPMAAESHADSYLPGGGTYGSGNQGGAGGGKNSDAGMPDMKSLLAAFLPQENQQPQNSILDFGNGRDLASVGGGEQLLGPEANLFHRVHEAYQVKIKSGSVGN